MAEVNDQNPVEDNESSEPTNDATGFDNEPTLEAPANAVPMEDMFPPIDVDDETAIEAGADESVVGRVGGKAKPRVKSDVEKMFDELEETKMRLLRVSADYQNYVRRSQQNADRAREQQLMDISKNMLGVLDTFDHALSVDPETTPTQAVLQGVAMVKDELMRSLGRFGVERLDVAVGEEFDPNRHEALLQQAVEGVEPGHVSMQLQPGYLMGDRTLRPAKVAVAP